DPALRVGRSPGGLRGLGVFDSGAHFVLGGQRHLGLHRPVERLEDVRRAAALACHMLAADEMSDIAHRRTSLMIALEGAGAPIVALILTLQIRDCKALKSVSVVQIL